MKRTPKIALATVLGLFVAIQLWPVARTNPPVAADLDAPADVESILRRACYDCHSNETAWPWYAYVAPVSWLVAHDVEEGREKLNFSRWGEMKPAKRSGQAEEIVEEVADGAMPLPNYLRVHPEAAVSSTELETLRRWADDLP